MATQPEKAAYVMAATGAVVTFAELDAAANRLAHLLRAAGVQPGDHVAFCMENHPRYLEVAWGCHYAGRGLHGVLVTADERRARLHPRTTAGRRSSSRRSTRPTRPPRCVADTPGVALRLMLDGTIDGYESYEDAVAAQPAEPLADRIAGTDMLYSSGTTGLPEGRHPGVRRRAAGDVPVRRRRRAAAAVRRQRVDRVYLSPAPLYHAAPLRFSMSIIALGGTVVVMEHFDAEEYLALVERYHVTHSQVVPTMFVRLLKLARRRAGALRRVVAGVRHPRRRAVPGAGEAADDRVVRPGDPRVLRRHRGQRLRVLQQRAVAGPPGHRRCCRSAACSTSSARTARRCRPARAARSTSRAGPRSSTTTTPRRRRARATRRAGARSATSATSTTTATCT